MSTVHVTNGDVAAQSLRTALEQAQRADRVFPLRDDLAVGPLRGLDEAHEVRMAFWQRVIRNPRRDFASEFSQQASSLEQIARADSHVVVWHAESAGDQLMLRRLCYHLRNSPQRLNEVRLSIRDLSDPGAWAHTRADQATAVGMFAPKVLEARLPDAAPISVLRISRLALEWQEVKQVNGETRRWRDNTFTSGTFAELDALILEHVSGDWQPAARVAAEVMRAEFGYLVSDSVVLWRYRELADSGRVRLRGSRSAWRTLEISAPVPVSSS